MLSYTAIYGLFALTSILLFNALILLTRYVQQTKKPPQDEDFEVLMQEKSALQKQGEQAQNEIISLKSSLTHLEQEIRKMEENLRKKTEDYENLKRENSAKAAS